MNFYSYKQDITDFKTWMILQRNFENFYQFQSLIKNFPSHIMIVTESSWKQDKSLYMNEEAQRLCSQASEPNNIFSLRGFLSMFNFDPHDPAGSPLQSESPTTLIDIIWNYLGKSRGLRVSSFFSYTVEFNKKAVSIEKLLPFEELKNFNIREGQIMNERGNTLNHARYEIKVGCIEWSGEEAVIVILNDMSKTERIQQLKMMHEHKDKLLENVSHELRTPLNSIIGMIDTVDIYLDDKGKINDKNLNENYNRAPISVINKESFYNKEYIYESNEKSKKKIKKYLSIARNSAKTLLFKINDIIDVSQLQKGSLRLCMEFLPLEPLIKQMLPLVEMELRKKGVALKFENLSPEGTLIKTDPTRFQQIFLNLLINARKFTNFGSITIAIRPSHQGDRDIHHFSHDKNNVCMLSPGTDQSE
jgi:signal transduction histidine kinase